MKYSFSSRAFILISPLPGCTYTRAMEVFLLPIVLMICIVSELYFFGLLCYVRMFSAGINVQASVQFTTESVFGKHAAYSVLDQTLRVLFANHGRRVLTLTTRIAGVCKEHASGPFLARHAHFLSVDDNNVITAIHV